MRNLLKMYSDKIMGGPLLGVHIFLFFLCKGLHPVAQNSVREERIRLDRLYFTPHMLRYSKFVFRSISWPSSGAWRESLPCRQCFCRFGCFRLRSLSFFTVVLLYVLKLWL